MWSLHAYTHQSAGVQLFNAQTRGSSHDTRIHERTYAIHKNAHPRIYPYAHLLHADTYTSFNIVYSHKPKSSGEEHKRMHAHFSAFSPSPSVPPHTYHVTYFSCVASPWRTLWVYPQIAVSSTWRQDFPCRRNFIAMSHCHWLSVPSTDQHTTFFQFGI